MQDRRRAFACDRKGGDIESVRPVRSRAKAECAQTRPNVHSTGVGWSTRTLYSACDLRCLAVSVDRMSTGVQTASAPNLRRRPNRESHPPGELRSHQVRSGTCSSSAQCGRTCPLLTLKSAQSRAVHAYRRSVWWAESEVAISGIVLATCGGIEGTVVAIVRRLCIPLRANQTQILILDPIQLGSNRP